MKHDLLLLTALVTAGCASIGPGTVNRRARGPRHRPTRDADGGTRGGTERPHPPPDPHRERSGPAGRRFPGCALSRPLVLDRRPRHGIEAPVHLPDFRLHARGDRREGSRPDPDDPDAVMEARIMHPAPAYPALYQVNTRVWLTERSRALGRPGALA